MVNECLSIALREDKVSEPTVRDPLKGQMVKGAAWMAGMRWSLKFIGLINTVILARLLAPEDFGVIAMAMVVVGLLEQLSDFYVDQVLLREKNPDRQMYDSAWSIQLCSGLVFGVFVVLAAPYVASFYGDERVELVVIIVAGRAVIFGFTNIGVVDFRKNLDFKKEFKFWVGSRLAQFVLTLGIVLYFQNYIALAVAIPLAMVIKVTLSYRMSSYRPRLCFQYVRPFWHFAKWLVVTNVAQFINRRGDEFVVGNAAEAETVGSYYLASDISAMLTREILQPTGRAFLPIYSKLLDDPRGLSDAFRLVLCFSACIAFPIGFGASVVADDFILVVLGDQWRFSIPFFKWLAIFGALAGFVSVTKPMLVVQKHERAFALIQVWQATTSIPIMFFVASVATVLDVAIARTMLMIVFTFIYLWVLVKYCRQSPSAILFVLWRPLAASTMMAGVVLQLHHSVFDNIYLSLAFDVLAGSVSYILFVTVLWFVSGRPNGAERETVLWVKQRIKSRGAKLQG